MQLQDATSSGLENDPGEGTVSAVADLAGMDRAEFEAVVSAAIEEYDKEGGSDEQLRKFVAHVYAAAVGGALDADGPDTAMEIYENAVARRTDVGAPEAYLIAFHTRVLETLGGRTPEDRHERHDRLLERAADEADLTYGTLAPAYLDRLADSDDHDTAWLAWVVEDAVERPGSDEDLLIRLAADAVDELWGETLDLEGPPEFDRVVAAVERLEPNRREQVVDGVAERLRVEHLNDIAALEWEETVGR
jgi:hypothetical protein